MAVPYFKRLGGVVTGTTGVVTPSWPTHEIGDLALLIVEANYGTSGTQNSIALTDAQGFAIVGALVQNTGVSGSIAGTQLGVYWCIATSTSMSAPSVQSNNDHIIARIITFGAAKSVGDPINVTASDATVTASSTSHTFPTVTTTMADCLIVPIGACHADSATIGASAWTNANLFSLNANSICDTSTNTAGGGGLIATAGILSTAGATGTTAVTTATSEVVAMMTVAISPDTTGTAVSTATLDALTSAADITSTLTASATITLGALILNGVSPPATDTTAPVISNFSPTDGSSIRTDTVLSFDVTDTQSLALVALFATWTDPDSGLEIAEIIHDGDAFRGNYVSVANTRTAISGGYSFTVRRDSGWEDDGSAVVPVNIEFLVLDASGNVGAI